MMKSLFRLDSGQVFNLANLTTANWTPPQSAPPAMQAQECRLQLLFVGGYIESLRGPDAQAVWDYLCHLSTKQLTSAEGPRG